MNLLRLIGFYGKNHKFYDKIDNINLPEFIDKYINGQLPKDYTYEFFNENENQICSYISIWFNFNNLYYLINGLKKDDNWFNIKHDRLMRSFARLKVEKAIEEMRNINENKENQLKEIF